MRKVKIQIDFDVVKDYYFNEKMPHTKIANLLGISSDTLYYRMKKEGIKLRNGSQRQVGELNHQYNKPISDSTKCKLSEALGGEKNPFYNKKHRPESIQKIKDNLPEMCGINNPFFNKKHTLDSRVKISIANGGDGTFKEDNYPKEFNYKLRNCVLELYGNICRGCLMSNDEHLKMYGRSLECHHIDYNKRNNDIFNFVSLCKKCNIKVNKGKNFWQNYFENLVFDLRFSLLEQLKDNRLKNFKEVNILKQYFGYLEGKNENYTMRNM